ncbi:NUDIX domain-containing protein [Deinococcus altitudinis]|uniref:NUDIX domain-containing protein n=1 Tax=Deinococcus altitudinis TaxID=468914 RepID=UPI0038920A7D
MVQLVGAGVVCLNPAGEVLMVRRADNGQWDLPGGRVEPGEEVRAAALRELLEETGLRVAYGMNVATGMNISEPELLGVFSGPDTLHTYPDGNTVAWVTVLYLYRNVRGVVQAADDACEAGWFGLRTLPSPRSAVTDRYFHTLAARLSV